MSIEKITSKITGEAQAQRDAVLAEAKAQAEALLKTARTQAESLLAKEDARGLAEREKLISRRQSVAGIDSRKRLLAEKQDLIDQCFGQTVEAITAMDEEKYLSVLVAMGLSSGLTEGRLVFNEAERAGIGPKVAAALNEALSPQKKGFAVADETAAVKGGYLLLAGDVTINNTIEALVDENRSSLSSEVAAMLFSQEAAQ